MACVISIGVGTVTVLALFSRHLYDARSSAITIIINMAEKRKSCVVRKDRIDINSVLCRTLGK